MQKKTDKIALPQEDITLNFDRSTVNMLTAREGSSLRPSLIVVQGIDRGSSLIIDRSPMLIGRGEECDFIISDDGISRIHARVVLDDQNRCIIEDMNSTNGIWVGRERVARHVFSEGDKVVLGRSTILRFMRVDTFDEHYQSQMYESAVKDGLTGVFNRRYFDDMLRSDLGRKLLADSRGVSILSRDELRTVAHHVKRTRFTYGETLMCQGEDGESFYILIRGTVHGSIMNPDAPQPVEFDLHPGALFGEMSMLTGQARNATMTASTDCELLEFDRAAFARLLAMRREIPQMFSDLATARAAQNAASLARIRASAVLPPELACDRILHRLKRILGEWKER